MPTFTRSTDLGTTEINHTGQPYDVYDFTGATNRVNKPQPDYPLLIKSPPPSVEAFGGTTLGLLDPTIHRAKPTGLYANFNSAALFIQGCPNVHIHDWTFGTDDWRTATGHVWDAIRCNGHSSGDWLFERIWLRGCRDDAWEMDSVSGGRAEINTCLAEGCFGGISCTGDQLNRLIRVINTGLMMTNFFEDEGEGAAFRTFGPMFKPDASGLHGPQFYLEDTVLAYQTHDGAPMNMNGQFGGGRVREAFRRMTCGPNVFICVLAAGTLPSGFPPLPSGMQLLTGTAAQNKWLEKRAALIAEITGAPTGGGLVTRNVCSFNPSTRVITIDRRLALPSTTMTLTASNPGGSDTEDFAVTVA